LPPAPAPVAAAPSPVPVAAPSPIPAASTDEGRRGRLRAESQAVEAGFRAPVVGFPPPSRSYPSLQVFFVRYHHLTPDFKARRRLKIYVSRFYSSCCDSTQPGRFVNYGHLELIPEWTSDRELERNIKITAGMGWQNGVKGTSK
jgi:hypothetical protein